MKLRSILVAVALAGASIAPAAYAQAPAVVASAPDPERLALAKQMLASMNIRKMLPDVMKVMFANMPSGSDTVTRLQQSMLVGLDKTEPDFEAAMAETYAQLYTAAEMRAAIAFYSSPEGQSVLAKSGKAAQLSAAAMRSIAPEMIAAAQADFCSHKPCGDNDKAMFDGVRMGMGVAPRTK